MRAIIIIAARYFGGYHGKTAVLENGFYTFTT